MAEEQEQAGEGQAQASSNATQDQTTTDAAEATPFADFAKAHPGVLDPDDAGDSEPQANTDPEAKVEAKDAKAQDAAKPDAAKANEPTGLTDFQRQMAKTIGLTDEQIADADKDAAAAGQWIETAGRRLLAKFAELGRKAQGEPAATDAGKKATDQQAKPGEQPVGELVFSDSDDLLDAATVGKLNTLAGRLQTMEAAYTAVSQMVTNYQQQQADAAYAQESKELDATFDALADEIPAFGKGRMADFEAGSAEATARSEVEKLARQIIAGAKLDGETVSLPDAIRYAAAMKHTETIKQAARREVAAKVESRAKRIVPRPVARMREPAAKTADETFHDQLAAWSKKTGIPIPADED